MSRLINDNMPPGSSDADCQGIMAKCCLCGRAIDITGSDLPWDALCPRCEAKADAHWEPSDV